MLIPVGSIMAFGGEANEKNTEALRRKGWLFCNGDAVSKDDFGELYEVIGTAFVKEPETETENETFTLPDLRGRFIRGVTDDTERDPDAKGRSIGSYQEDALQGHSHFFHGFSGPSKTDGLELGTVNQNSPSTDEKRAEKIRKDKMLHQLIETKYGEPRCANETRPKNLNVNFIIYAG